MVGLQVFDEYKCSFLKLIMTQKRQYIIVTIFLFALNGLHGVAAEPIQVLADRAFANGFVLTGATHAAPRRTETFGRDNVQPDWIIAQWTSRGSLDDVKIDDDTISLSDLYKSVKIDRKTGAINLSADTSKEYPEPRKSSSEPWVHLLLEQSPFKKPVQIDQAKAIWAEIEFELTQFEAFGKNDPNLHAAQFSWYLYLKNTNKKSQGFGDFLWFGISLFDDRHDFIPLYAHQDFAVPNGKFIYTLGSAAYMKEKVAVGKRFKVRINLLPEIEKALAKANANGFLEHSTVKDMCFDGTNIGWEIPGMFDVGVTIHRLSLEIVE